MPSDAERPVDDDRLLDGPDSLKSLKKEDAEAHALPWVVIDSQTTDRRFEFLTTIQHLGNSAVIATRYIAQLDVMKKYGHRLGVMTVFRFANQL